MRRIKGIIPRDKIAEEAFLDLDGNSAAMLEDPLTSWIVQSGKVDVFAVQVIGGTPAGRRIPVFQAEEGQALFGFHPARGVGLLVSGVAGTTIMKRNIGSMIEYAGRKKNPAVLEPLIYFIESWIIGLSGALSQKALPARFISLQPGPEQEIKGCSPMRTGRDLLWVRCGLGKLQFMGNNELEIPPGSVFPITKKTWLQWPIDTRVQAFLSEELVGEGTDCSLLWSGFETFNNLAMDCIIMQAERSALDELERLKEKTALSKQLLKKAMALSVAEEQAEDEPGKGRAVDSLLTAAGLVAARMGIYIDWHDRQESTEKLSPEQRLPVLADRAGFKIRQVLLRHGWWRQDDGPLLAFLEEDGRPVALLPDSPSSYLLHDPADLVVPRVSGELAEKLLPKAYAFYRPFPDKALSLLDLIKTGFAGSWRRDTVAVLFMAILGGLLGIMLPVATGYLVDTVIPDGQKKQLMLLVLVLLVGGLANFGFQLTRSLAWLRVEGRLDGAIQAAVWNRLLDLPVSFFRRYTVGDLAVRANGVSIIRQVVSGVVINSVFAGLISIFNFLLLFVYSTALALTVAVPIMVSIIITAFLARRLVICQRSLTETEGRISGLVLQLISGIAKLKVAGAQNHAFMQWAGNYHLQRKITTQARTIGNYLMTINAGYPTLISMVVFYTALNLPGGELTSGSFLAFNAALTTFVASMLTLTASVIMALQVFPLYERLKPILEEKTETDRTGAYPGELTGKIEISHIRFRYHQDGPLVLQDVSVQAHPGEFVAIVGSSGSGKSTLFRLLLGFEQPEGGAVLYDGQDLSGLNVRQVRNQMGIVLQNDQLLSGDIFTCITGVTGASMEEAREAVKMAGLEEDIKNMPMGIHTFVNEGGATFSGGQRQRLLIARAIVKKPRIILFDEATSALDNATQAVVSESLEKMQATRIVIAHRINTIANADRIYVMDQGKVAQVGNYQELLNTPGLFADMAKRQLI